VFAAQAGLALAGTLLLAVSYSVGSAVGYGSQVDGVPHALGRLVPAALAHVPAMWVMAAVALLLWAWWPHATWAGWAALVGFVTLGEVGELLDLPGGVIGLSPVQHVPSVPVQPVEPGAELALLGVTALLLAAGWWRYRSRDIG
jgi:ABC-2 type transport system permease protein